MKLYLSSYRVPTPDELAALIGKPLDEVRVAAIPNGKDYFSQRARDFKIGDSVAALESLGMNVTVVDLREYADAGSLKRALVDFDLLWAMGGNTFILRFEMKRSGFDEIVHDLLEDGVVYGGESAGALVMGTSLAGIESADTPEFAEEVIAEGLGIVPYMVLPHADNAWFTEAVKKVRELHPGGSSLLELKDSQAVIFEDGTHRIVESEKSQQAVVD